MEAKNNKGYCTGKSSFDPLITDGCKTDLINQLKLQINENCFEKNKCNIKVNLSDVKKYCKNFAIMDIYLTYSCFSNFK